MFSFTCHVKICLFIWIWLFLVTMKRTVFRKVRRWRRFRLQKTLILKTTICACGHVLFSYLAGCFLYISLVFVWSRLWFVFLSRWLFPLLIVSVRVVMFVICFPISLVVSFTYRYCSCGHVCDLFSYLAGCFLYLSLVFVWSCLWFVFLSRWLFPLLIVIVRVVMFVICFPISLVCFLYLSLLFMWSCCWFVFLSRWLFPLLIASVRVVMFVICFPISLVVSFAYRYCSCGHVCDLFSYLAGCFLYLSLLFVMSCL